MRLTNQWQSEHQVQHIFSSFYFSLMPHQFDVCNWERFPSCAQILDGITIFIDIGLWLHVFYGAYRS